MGAGPAHRAAKIVKGGTGDDFILAIDEALAENPFAQAAFLSAHGTKEGLHLHRKQADPMVYFQQVADVFKKHEARQESRLRLVMGACHAGSSIVPLRDLLPMCVTRYTAFQGEPSAGNVSEMVASVIGNKINLFKDIQDAIETGTVGYKSGMKPSEVLEQLVTPTLDAHKRKIRGDSSRARTRAAIYSISSATRRASGMRSIPAERMGRPIGREPWR